LAVELFGNDAATTVTSGGADVAAQGAVETWIVPSLGNFPVVSSSSVPPTQCHATDIAANTELFEVTNMSGAGNLTWTVTRGAEGTIPVAHDSGFTIYGVTSAGFLGSLASQAQVNTFTADQRFISGRPWFDLTGFGADPTGVADSTQAFVGMTGAIAAAAGLANPAANSRNAVAGVYMAPGTYKVTADILIQSVIGFHLFGGGADITTIEASGTGFTTAVLNVDGSLDGLFEGFTVAGDGTEQVTNAINLTWTTAAHRSTSGNAFEDIRIRNLNFVTGISLAGSGSRQLDGTVLRNITITGAQVLGSWSATGNWQNGVVFGNGTYGNIYNQYLYDVSCAGCYYGYYCNASSFALWGAEPFGNCIDFWILPSAPCTIENVQSQNASQLIVSPSSIAGESVSVRDVQFSGYVSGGFTNLAWIYLWGAQEGVWIFENCQLVSGLSIINLGETSYGTYSPSFTLINVSQYNPPSAGIVPGTGVQVIAVNYKDMTGYGLPYGTQYFGTLYPLYCINAGVLYQQGTFAGRTDSTGTSTTSGSRTVGDTSAVTGDLHSLITGTGIPASTVVSAVTGGTGYTISQPATATGTPALTVGGRPAPGVYGEGFYYCTDTLALYRSNGADWTQIQVNASAVAPYASQTLVSAAASIVFSSIPSGYNLLHVVVTGASAKSAENDLWLVRVNGDSGAHYDYQSVQGSGTTASASNHDAGTAWYSTTTYDAPGASATAGTAGFLDVEIPAYAGTTFQKTGSWSSGYNDAATATADAGINAAVICWRSTAAITSVTVAFGSGSNLVAGTTALLYLS
jgi:hypothetical protein